MANQGPLRLDAIKGMNDDLEGEILRKIEQHGLIVIFTRVEPTDGVGAFCKTRVSFHQFPKTTCISIFPSSRCQYAGLTVFSS